MTPRLLSAVLALAALLVACQPVEDPVSVATSAGVAATDPLGSPDEEFPRTLAELRERGMVEALTWQDEPRLADATVWLDQAGEWQRVRLTYVAPFAERLLTVRIDPETTTLERPSLAGLALVPVDDVGIDALSPLPEAAPEPADLGRAAAGALEQCRLSGPVLTVLYATGAPGSWDGERWTLTPNWRATVLTDEGGVVVDPVTAAPFAPLICVDALSDET